MSQRASAPDNAQHIPPTTHPDFVRREDIVLRSIDNVWFNVARRDLEPTSGWFRVTFDKATEISTRGTISELPVSEDSSTLEVVLKVALGLSLDAESLASIEACEALFIAAKKYDMSGVKQVVLLHLQFALQKANDPMLEYVIACRHDLPALQATAFDRCTRVEIDYTSL